MEVFICILIMTICVLLARNYMRKWMSLLTVFTALWTVILVFSKMGLYNMTSVSEKAYMMVSCGCVMFGVGYITHMEIKKAGIAFKVGLKSEPYDKLEFEWGINTKFVFVLELVVLCFEAYISVRALSIIFGGGNFSLLHDMAGGYAETSLLNGALETYFDSLIVMPSIFALIPICLILAFENHPHKILHLVVFIADLGLYILVHGGRVVILYVIVDLLLLYSIYGRQMSKKTKRLIKRLVLIAVIAIFALTLARKGLQISDEGALESVFTSIYKYFSVSMPLLDHWIDYVDSHKFSSYGMATFHGLLGFINLFSSRVGLPIPGLAEMESYVQITETTFITGLYDHGEFNAFVSMFYFFYLDFGWIGVCLESYIYGYICHFCESLGGRRNLLKCAYYLLVAQSVIKSFGRWEFYLMSFSISFVIIRLVFYKKKLLT